MMRADRQKIAEKESLFYAANADYLDDQLKKLDLWLTLWTETCSQKNTADKNNLGVPSPADKSRAGDRPGAAKATGRNKTAPALVRTAIADLQKIIDEKVRRTMEAGIFLGIPALAKIFTLSRVEQDFLLICLAPELNAGYGGIYAALPGNHQSTMPTRQFILNLLGQTETQHTELQRYLRGNAPVFSAGILEECQWQDSQANLSMRSSFRVDPRIIDFILGLESMDRRLQGVAELHLPTADIDALYMEEETRQGLKNFINHEIIENKGSARRHLINLYGPLASGRQETALSLCRMLNCNLLTMDLNLFAEAGEDFEAMLRLAFREALLQAGLYFYNFDHFPEARRAAFLRKIAIVNAELGWLTFLETEAPLSPAYRFPDTALLTLTIPLPSLPLREKAWRDFLEKDAIAFARDWPGQLALQARLSTGSIKRAVQSARQQALLDSAAPAQVSLLQLGNAARNQYFHNLDRLARKIVPKNGWQDLVLPASTMEQLREICIQLRHRDKVLQQWGYGRKFSYGNGLSVLFHGPSGTGKTLAAEVIAKEMQLDLYKIDLSRVVSKYIGETEKNLAALFQEAGKCNAILFFDEADALFTKRTNVADAHDRYANMETSFLLQLIEEYDGAAILSSNFKQNIDQAFLRRLKCIVDFPFPDKTSRLRIWKNSHPREAPLGNDIDFELLAASYTLSGGNIRNILLNGAFLAADEEKEISMSHLLRATRREYEKTGKNWPGDFS
jgi:hypothetical protein